MILVEHLKRVLEIHRCYQPAHFLDSIHALVNLTNNSGFVCTINSSTKNKWFPIVLLNIVMFLNSVFLFNVCVWAACVFMLQWVSKPARMRGEVRDQCWVSFTYILRICISLSGAIGWPGSTRNSPVSVSFAFRSQVCLVELSFLCGCELWIQLLMLNVANTSLIEP